MLYDPKWEVKADPFSLETLIAWLEKQPADKTYDYCEIGQCMIAQYLKSHGVKRFELTPGELRDHGWWMIANDPDQTFGAALKRARAASR